MATFGVQLTSPSFCSMQFGFKKNFHGAETYRHDLQIRTEVYVKKSFRSVKRLEFKALIENSPSTRRHFFGVSNRSRSYQETCCSRPSKADDVPEDNLCDEEENGLATTLTDNIDMVVLEASKVAETISSVGEVENNLQPRQLVEHGSAIKTVAFWVSAAVAFGTIVGFQEGGEKASEFFAGYLLEQSLSVDNLFVFVLIFSYFKVPVSYQGRVLTFGIAGAIVFRAAMIFLGIATLKLFEAVNLIFAGILLFSSYKLFTESEEEEVDLSSNFVVNICQKFIPVSSSYDGNNFFTYEKGIKKATPLLLALAVVELSDIVFAVDSIPAVFGVTRDPLIVFSSNMFAILERCFAGLRSLYTIISGSMGELEYLQPSIAAILGFIGTKMVADYLGFRIPTELSLAVVGSILGVGISMSLLIQSQKE